MGDSDDSVADKPRAKKRDPGAGAWSAQKERKELRAVRKEKRAAKRAFLKSQPQPQPAQKDDDDEEEEDDWDEDYRQLKKQKRANRKPTNGPSDDFASDSAQSDNEQQEPF